MALAGTGEVVGEENVVLSGLPARKVIVVMPYGQLKLRDWVTFLVTRNSLWIFHVIGPEAEMSSPSTAGFQAAQKFADSFAFLDPVLQVLKAQVLTPPPPLRAITVDAANRRHYANREVAMQVLLPEGWQESNENSPSFQEGKMVVLRQTGTLAIVILAREELEASPELYIKTLATTIKSNAENFQQISQEKITRQGFQGTHIVWVTREGGVDYRNVVEVFSCDKQHFRVIARAPTEVFDRYAPTFNEMLESVQFLPVANTPPPDKPLPVPTAVSPK
jgi:hypothetical protein